MSLNRIPLFVWAQLVASFMVLFAMPAVTLCSTLLSMDRLTNVSTHFFNHAEGGDHLLWQHLFWFFGHPDVYIIFIPATGFIAAIVPTFARRKIFGYTPLVLSMIATGFIGFGVWVHHMFATPLPELGQGMFTASSLLITIPAGVQIFCWLATLWGGRPVIKTPLLFVPGFFAIFVLGGLTGVMLASVSIDLQVHDTFFVVAHLHYVLIGGGVFPLIGAVYYWLPKWTGRMPGEALGRARFWLLFAGFNMTFYPLHHLGMHGMTRRVYTYLPETGWGRLNFLATVGAFVMGLGLLALMINLADDEARSNGRSQPLGRGHARMGHDVAAAELWLPLSPDGAGPRAGLGERPRRSGRDRHRHRQARSPVYHPARRRARPPLRHGRQLDLAAAGRAGHRGRVDRIHVPPDRPADRRGADGTGAVGWFWHSGGSHSRSGRGGGSAPDDSRETPKEATA